MSKLQAQAKRVWNERMIYSQNRHLGRFVFFLAVVIVVCFQWVGMDALFLSRDALQQAVAMRFVDEEWQPGNRFLDVATPGDWWTWAEGPLLDALYEDPLAVWENGILTGGSDDPRPPPTQGGDRFPLLGGLGTAVGAPRLRMLATEPNEGDPGTGACSYGRMSGGDRQGGRLENPASSVCFSHYTKGTAVTSDLVKEYEGADFGAGATFDDSFAYRSPSTDVSGYWHAPKIYGHQNYFNTGGYPGSGGFSAEFPKDRPAGEALIAGLRNSSWISANTRAVVFEAVVYAPADHWGYNLLVDVALMAEFAPTGAVVCSGRVRSLRLFLYHTWRDGIRVVLEVIWVLYVLCVQFREEARQISAVFSNVVRKDKRWALEDWVSPAGRRFLARARRGWRAIRERGGERKLAPRTPSRATTRDPADGSAAPAATRPQTDPRPRPRPRRDASADGPG